MICQQRLNHRPLLSTFRHKFIRARQVICQRQQHSHASKEHEEVHNVSPKIDRLDYYLEQISKIIYHGRLTSVKDLYQQYLDEAGNVIDRVVPYEETPLPKKRADLSQDVIANDTDHEGDGLVLVVHAHLDASMSHFEKTAVCSGFVVDASVSHQDQGDLVITCAHTLDEISRHLKRTTHEPKQTFSFIVTANGQPRPVTRLLSSMPRSDVIVLETQPASSHHERLRSLPLTPFPVHHGTPILTHLFGSPDPPVIQHSIARIKARPAAATNIDKVNIERPIPWIAGYAWRRWGAGQMLGYRSYTGLEVEAGVSSILPHILTSVLPTSGSSGGPLVRTDTGCIVGMTSGRRMDNRVEGERGWGCSAEGIFEMFSLPGFMPMKR